MLLIRFQANRQQWLYATIYTPSRLYEPGDKVKSEIHLRSHFLKKILEHGSKMQKRLKTGEPIIVPVKFYFDDDVSTATVLD